MIGLIQGVLVEVDSQHILVDVSGVGYEVEVPFTTAFSLPQVGEKIKLYTHFVVREDAQLLYGFNTRNDRLLFRLLIKISGVGPKLGIAILSGLSAKELIQCIHSNDISTLVKLPGVGKKTAERLVIEMRDKVKAITDLVQHTPESASIPIELNVSNDLPLLDAEAALISLGYKSAIATKVIRSLDTEGLATQEIIRLALQKMVS
jgi:Holliday junction DNA helicase RuvA